MILQSEIKNFVKKIFIIGIFLSILINIFVTYFIWFDSFSTSWKTNEQNFKKIDTYYLWSAWVALSYNIWSKKQAWDNLPINIFNEVMPVSYILSNKKIARDTIITNNMININEYINILKTDINKLLDNSIDRGSMIESFLDQIKYRYTNSLTQINILNKQKIELQKVLDASNVNIEKLKQNLTNAYQTLNYDKTQESLDAYLAEKEKNIYTSTYLVFVNKFITSYTTLNNFNKIFLDTIINNKDALIKNVTVVLPDSGNSLLNQMNLIKTETQYKWMFK